MIVLVEPSFGRRLAAAPVALTLLSDWATLIAHALGAGANRPVHHGRVVMTERRAHAAFIGAAARCGARP